MALDQGRHGKIGHANLRRRSPGYPREYLFATKSKARTCTAMTSPLNVQGLRRRNIDHGAHTVDPDPDGIQHPSPSGGDYTEVVWGKTPSGEGAWPLCERTAGIAI